MGRIYALASRTVIWIGEFDPQRRSCPPCYGDEDDKDTLCTLPDHTTSVEHADVVPDLARNVKQLQEKERSGSTEV